MVSAYRSRGTYEWLHRRERRARTWWERSQAVGEKLGTRFELGVTHLEMGKRLGDRAHLEAAANIFAAIGAQFDLRQARALLESIEAAQVS